MMRLVYIAIGCTAVVLGVAGIFLPLLPTTPFLLLAAWAFARSSPRLEAWLVRHPRLGPPISAWRERGAIPARAKIVAIPGDIGRPLCNFCSHRRSPSTPRSRQP